MKLLYLEKQVQKADEVKDIAFDMSCDVLCVGVGTAGSYAAIAAAREGASVIAVENSRNIGGMHVQGIVNGYYYGFAGGTFEEDDKIGAQDTQNRVFPFATPNPEAKQIHITERLRNSGVQLLCGHTPIGIYFEGQRAVGLKVFDGSGIVNIQSKQIIDATSDGHLIRMCPVSTHCGRTTDGKMAPFTIRAQFIHDNTYRTKNGDSGYVNQYKPYEFSKKIVDAHANTTEFLNEGELLSIGWHTGVREGLAFEGETTLHYEDLIFQRPIEKPLFYAYSDLDRHGNTLAVDEENYQNWWCISNLGTVTIRIPVPLGSVVPKGLTGIVTAGRCLSCDTYTQSAVRMNRDMFRMGECVGIAAAMAAQNDCSFLEIDYETFVQKAEHYNCFSGDKEKTFGFHFPGKDRPYTPLRFPLPQEQIIEMLKTERPGAAVWSCFVSDGSIADRLAQEMQDTDDTLYRYNCAIALGIMNDRRCLDVLREMVQQRSCFYFKDCRRTNQFRSAIAICLLGRLGDESDLAVIEPIVFDPDEIKKELYHTLKPDYLYYSGLHRNFVYFQHFTHAAMALVKLYRRCGLDISALNRRFQELFADERIIRNVTDDSCDKPNYLEISDFTKYLLKITKG